LFVSLILGKKAVKVESKIPFMEAVVLAFPHLLIIPPCFPTIASMGRPVLFLALGRAIVYLLALAAFFEWSGLCIALFADGARECHFRCRGG